MWPLYGGTALYLQMKIHVYLIWISGTMIHHLVKPSMLCLCHETMVCALCLSIFLWIRYMARLLRATFVSWWYLPQIWPSVTDMQHYYHASYPTDDWHLAYMFFTCIFFPSMCVWKACFPILLAQGEVGLGWGLGVGGNLNWRMGLPAVLGGNMGCWIFQFPLILHSYGVWA